MKIQTILAGTLCLSSMSILGAKIPDDVRHRREVRAALADKKVYKYKTALEAALSDSDALVRRHALALAYADCVGDEAKIAALAKRFADDKTPSIRRFVKAMRHKGGLYCENNPLSLSDQNDHAMTKLKSIRPKAGVFKFEESLPKHEAIELWFGRPKTDMYVWVNDHYVGQFDADIQKGREFRLDVTTSVDDRPGIANTIVVRDGDNKEIKARINVEVLTWKY